MTMAGEMAGAIPRRIKLATQREAPQQVDAAVAKPQTQEIAVSKTQAQPENYNRLPLSEPTPVAFRINDQKIDEQVNADEAVVNAMKSGDQTTLTAAKKQAHDRYAKQVWGDFARENPAEASSLATKDWTIGFAIEAYKADVYGSMSDKFRTRLDRYIEADRNVVGAINSGDDLEKADQREQAARRHQERAWLEAVSEDPQGARLVTNLNPAVAQALKTYDSPEYQAELKRRAEETAQRAEAAAKTNGSVVGLAVAAEEPAEIVTPIDEVGGNSSSVNRSLRTRLGGAFRRVPVIGRGNRPPAGENISAISEPASTSVVDSSETVAAAEPSAPPNEAPSEALEDQTHREAVVAVDGQTGINAKLADMETPIVPGSVEAQLQQVLEQVRGMREQITNLTAENQTLKATLEASDQKNKATAEAVAELLKKTADDEKDPQKRAGLLALLAQMVKIGAVAGIVAGPVLQQMTTGSSNS